MSGFIFRKMRKAISSPETHPGLGPTTEESDMDENLVNSTAKDPVPTTPATAAVIPYNDSMKLYCNLYEDIRLLGDRSAKLSYLSGKPFVLPYAAFRNPEEQFWVNIGSTNLSWTHFEVHCVAFTKDRSYMQELVVQDRPKGESGFMMIPVQIADLHKLAAYSPKPTGEDAQFEQVFHFQVNVKAISKLRSLGKQGPETAFKFVIQVEGRESLLTPEPQIQLNA